MSLKKLFAAVFAFCVVGAIAVVAVLLHFSSTLPQMIKVEDYEPLLVTEVYARGGEKIGEYFREKRTILPYDKIPQQLIHSFLAAEDDTFFEHGGINYIAIMRAFVVNMMKGARKQGASTITQQVARSLLLSSEKTYTRKIKEILLSYRMEQNLSKEDILYLYLNQIYFGEGAYGVAAAAETYFRKSVDQLTLPEMAILAGLPQAPSSYSPTDNPQKAKARQKYVLGRMASVGFVSKEDAEKAAAEPVQIFRAREYKQVAPYFVETLRQLLVQQLGEKAVLDGGLRVHTSIDFKTQQEANAQVIAGLRAIDKRQGYRGPLKNITDPAEQEKFLLTSRKKLKQDRAPIRIIKPDGNVEPEQPLEIIRQKDASGKIVSNFPPYINKDDIIEGLVIKVDDKNGLATVRWAEGIGLLDVGDMGWARKPDFKVNADYAPKVTKIAQVLKEGDVILVRVAGEKFQSQRLAKEMAASKTPRTDLPNFDEHAYLTLEQEPLVEGSLLSFDQKTGEVLAMVGGKEFIRNRNEFNRTLQAKRQTGSSFKTIVYAAALDKGFTPSTAIQDAPVVFETKNDQDDASEGQEEDVKVWKPHNHGQKFVGDILFRTALIRSLNIPAVKVQEKIGVQWSIDYARRLGVFSPLNPDLSLVLGSSSLTLYEMTKVFSQFGRLGKRIHPLVIHKVLDKDGKEILVNVTLDKRFEKETAEIDQKFEERRKAYLEAKAASQSGVLPDGTTAPPAAPVSPEATVKAANGPQIFFEDPDQLISPQTAYVMTTLLSGVVYDEGGTAARARALGRPVAGKTGTTNAYVDAWFVGYSAQVATGVWVGFDEEKTLGPGEVGGRAALPIWVEYMKAAHKDLPEEDFPVPPGVVFANIDKQTGRLASASSGTVVRQAFIQGTEPSLSSSAPTKDDEAEFLKKDLAE